MIFGLAELYFAKQSSRMESKWAEENLQTIRTLMERSVLYRRALAPIMLFAGMLGVVAAAVGLILHLDSMRAFGITWLNTAVIAVVGAFLIARRQAVKDKGKFLVTANAPRGAGFGAAFDCRSLCQRRCRLCHWQRCRWRVQLAADASLADVLRLRSACVRFFHAAWN